jgi:hypothetical protein
MKADIVVIMIGTEADDGRVYDRISGSIPSSRCRVSAKSTIMMAFFFTNPTNMTMPT